MKVVAMLGLIVGEKATDQYAVEILTHAGIPFRAVMPKNLHPERTPICLLAGQKSLTTEERNRLQWFVRKGGSLIAVGATNGLDDLLGVQFGGELEQGWIHLTSPHPIGNGLQSSLHVFGGVVVKAKGDSQTIAEVVNSNDEVLGDAIVIREFGQGQVIFIAPDLMRSIVHIQQGIPVTKDGTPAPDGSAPIDDGILKTEDGHVLDWQRDRTVLGRETRSEGREFKAQHSELSTPNSEQPWVFFGQPIADELRALLLQAIFFAAQQKKLPLPMIWFWQNGLPAVGLISHDTDGNEPELAKELLQMVQQLGIATTWCVLYPGGYPPSLYRAILDAGCEIALHFDAFTGTPFTTWSKRNLRIQRQWLKDATGVAAVSNKNHYTRWEGRLEFFRWCEELGIRVEQSKGASKRGTIGFLFGGSHPWRPLDDEGDRTKFLNVTAINLFSQDMVADEVVKGGIFHPAIVPISIGGWLLQQTVRVSGIAHFLFHPAHICRQGTKAALERLVTLGHESGIKWQTSKQIIDWLEQRRSVRQVVEKIGNKWLWRLKAAKPVEGLTLLRLLPAEKAHSADRFVYGFPFAQSIVALEGELASEPG